MLIIPAVLAKNKTQYASLMQKVTPLSYDIHLDFMDGNFVETMSIKPKQLAPFHDKHHRIWAHLMTRHPQFQMVELIKKGVNCFCIHEEVLTGRLYDFIQYHRDHSNIAVFLTLNPETHPETVKEHEQGFDGVLVMTVHPGKYHSPFIEETLDKVKYIRKHYPEMLVAVDGAACPETVAEATEAGADIYFVGSYIAFDEKPSEAFAELQDIALTTSLHL